MRHREVVPDRLRPAPMAGDTDPHPVSFAGVGHPFTPDTRADFASSLRHFRPSLGAVVEGERAWYHRSEPEILAFLNDPARRRPRTVTLGNSTGGFGAIHFGGLPACHRLFAAGGRAS